MKSRLKIVLLLAALCPAAAEAEPIPEQCRTAINDFITVQSFVAACPYIAESEIRTKTRIRHIYEGLARHSACQADPAALAELRRLHPAARVFGADGKRRASRAETAAYCRNQRPELARIVRQYNPDDARR